jgi:hypothetical protein
MYLKMDDLTEIMDQLNLENDQEMKKIIDNGKLIFKHCLYLINRVRDYLEI